MERKHITWIVVGAALVAAYFLWMKPAAGAPAVAAVLGTSPAGGTVSAPPLFTVNTNFPTPAPAVAVSTGNIA